MACSMWEEVGLLYSSDELSEQDKKSFVEHMQKCSECSSEYEWYLRSKKELFNDVVLSETPSASCDAEIMRVCGDGRKKYTGFSALPVFFKKSVVSVALFLATFTIAGYFAFQMDASRGSQIADENTTQPVTQQQQGVLAENKAANTEDSLKDSLGNSNVNFSKTRGNLNTNGVVPVNDK